MSKSSRIRPFLKWAGGKSDLAARIMKKLPEADVLVEPFVGSGAVFINSDFKRYILNDINEDLINLYIHVQKDSGAFIKDARRFFTLSRNEETSYYALRSTFNNSKDTYERSLLFLYLNRHGFNGLCRYNKAGHFNVPFGRYKQPYFPEIELHAFAEKATKAKFVCEDFARTFARARRGHVIYCDPPYAPLSKTANFSDYAIDGFSAEDHQKLADLAKRAAAKGVGVLISNHDTPYTRKLYKGAKISRLQVKRNISCDGGNRRKVGELMVLYIPEAE